MVDTASPLTLVIADEGVKSLAALPIIRYLARSTPLKIGYIFGSGGGATLGALFAMGLDDNEIIKAFKELYSRDTVTRMSYKCLFSIMTRNIFGGDLESLALCKNKKILKKFRSIFKNVLIEDLDPKLTIQTTVLTDGSGYPFQKGSLAEILYASNALYPLMPPIEIDDEFFVSGVYSSALPLINSAKYWEQPVLGINFTYPKFGETESYFEYWMNLIHHSYVAKEQKTLNAVVKEKPELISLLSVDFDKGISLWDISKIPYILDQGEKAAKEKLKFVGKIMTINEAQGIN